MALLDSDLSGRYAITNTGNIDLSWSAALAPPVDGLVLQKTTGVVGPGASDDVVILVDADGLAPDTYTTTLEIETNGGTAAVNVTL